MIAGLSAPERPEAKNCASAAGTSAMMPTKMISEMPLPMPRAVICSPSHIRNMVPPTSVIMHERRKIHARLGGQIAGFERHRKAIGLHRGQQHGAIAGVLVDLLAALLALFLQLFQRRHHRGQQLYDDRGRDIGHDPERKDAHPAQRAAGEHRYHAADALACLFHEFAQRRAVDAGHRNEGTEAVDDQKTQGEQDAVAQIGGFAEGGPAGVRRHLFCC